MRAPLLLICGMLPALAGIAECTVEQPPVSCELMDVLLTPDGELTVTNINDEAVTANIQIVANICTNQGCSFTGTYTDQMLAPGVTSIYVADEGSDVCTDQFCCANGYTATSTATVEVVEGLCTVGIVATKPTCGGGGRVETWRE